MTSGQATEPSDGSGAMFDRIAERYDMVNRVMSLGLDHSWRRKLVAATVPDGAQELLDLATGTGDVAVALARYAPTARVVGLDPSQGMVAVGRRKVDDLALAERVSLVIGDAQALPFEDDRFDGISMAFGIRNVPDRDLALREMARATRSGGHVAILELGEPQHGLLRRAARFHIREVVPRVGAWLTGDPAYRYLQQSIAAFPTPAQFGEQMTAAGLTVERIVPLGFGAASLFVARA